MSNIREIARIAGVSVSTVSRVLNNYPYVSEQKREAVLEAVERLNYSPNMNAVHLSKGKTNMIGIMLPGINHPYFARIMEGIASEALRENYQLVLFQTNYSSTEEMKTLNRLKMRLIDGIIICSKTLRWEDIEPFAEFGPVVACEDEGDTPISSIYVDHYASFQLGMNYLIERGHEKIGFCLSRKDSTSSVKRRSAYIDALNSIHQPIREAWMFYRCYHMKDGTAVVHKLLAMSEKPTALLVSSDQVAAGIIMEARKNGMSVPEDLAIIGFDNQPIAEVFDLTTIDNQLFQLGGNAFRILHDQITEKREVPERRELGFRLIERSTV
ncbi:LacI family DNA-binding transcriptional regulator [Aneurinibacillus sp. Ricciae_BoGa-3]|uniref:LacI family DNA-binding transcriptional regulator n=1 Tax=Aneurinibacillus sp. Ricciae_BoGa-3 TaxID=3022697 RepID=UPI002341577D|nr:LacI family DNA-binding transcriptional regulator [Aneurinibacillus sp. Ricciae_BoGa-3]WCK55599.1 LacI family DNA-binding transcriptional regulator [Aneurinibacillus sp. Ricciae_BoGa-3]